MSALASVAQYIGNLLGSLVPGLLPLLKRSCCGIKITSVNDKETVPPGKIIVSGCYFATFGMKLVIVSQMGNEYWPQGTLTLNQRHKTWEKDVWISEAVGERRISVLAVEDEAYSVFNYYYQTKGKAGKHIPITWVELPKGITVLDVVTVKVGK